LVKTANAVAINSVAGPVTGVIPPVSAPATGASVWYIDTSTSPDTLYFWDGAAWSVVGDSASLATQDEGVALGSTSAMNFVGMGVTATYAAGVTTVNVPGGAGTFATNAEAQAGTSTALMVNPANLYARENLAAQTGLANDPSTIPAPTAGQSNWGTTLLGERVHYIPGIGWKVVGDNYYETQNLGTDPTNPGVTLRYTWTAHRSGVVTASIYAEGASSGLPGSEIGVYIDNNVGLFSYDTSAVDNLSQGMSASTSFSFSLAAGAILNFYTLTTLTQTGVTTMKMSVVYN
jgi:hypothetical protein